MGLLKFPMQLLSRPPQYGFHNLRKGRVIDWLSLLNFQVLEIDHGAYNLAAQSSPVAAAEIRLGKDRPKDSLSPR